MFLIFTVIVSAAGSFGLVKARSRNSELVDGLMWKGHTW